MIVAAAAGTYYVVFLLPRRHQTIPMPSKQSDKNTNRPKAVFQRPEVSHLQNGHEVWRMRAGTIRTDETAGEMTDVDARFRLRSGRTVEFKAPKTQYNLKSRDVRIDGRSEGAIQPEGHTIQSDGVRWDNRASELTANDVRVKFGGGTVRADLLEIQPEGRHVRLSGHVEIDLPMGKRK